MQDTPLRSADSPLNTLTQQFGLYIFFGLIAVALGLIVYAFVSKWEAHRRNRWVTIGAAMLCALAAVFCQTQIDGERGFIADQEKRYDAKLKEIAKRKGKEEALKLQYMYMPKGDSLNYMTLNNPSLAADYVWLTSLQFVSNSFRRGDKFGLLSHFHKTMVDLDPEWVDAEVNGGKVLSALIEEREKAEESYKYDIEKNGLNTRDRWRLRYEAGLLYVMPPNDPNQMAEYSRKAAMYFDQAIGEAHFPKAMIKVTNDRVARLRLESGSAFYREAENTMAQNAIALDTPDSLRDISRRDWLKAHSMAQAAALADAAAAYKKKTGAFPPDLKLIAASFAHPESFIVDAYGFPFDYDAASGAVTSHGAKALHTVQAGHVVTELINLYRDNNNGRIPKDLAELRAFVRGHKQPPLAPPSIMVIEAIGKDLDPAVGPLGPWKYDPVKGELIMPPECEIKALYGHVNDYEWKPTGIVKKL